MLHLMYPRLEEWKEGRARLDPDHAFASDLARRLRL
jgi:decaprenylphospho-beta-D-ribofuranose 2-oxidase